MRHTAVICPVCVPQAATDPGRSRWSLPHLMPPEFDACGPNPPRQLGPRPRPALGDAPSPPRPARGQLTLPSIQYCAPALFPGPFQPAPAPATCGVHASFNTHIGSLWKKYRVYLQDWELENTTNSLAPPVPIPPHVCCRWYVSRTIPKYHARGPHSRRHAAIRHKAFRSEEEPRLRIKHRAPALPARSYHSRPRQRTTAL